MTAIGYAPARFTVATCVECKLIAGNGFFTLQQSGKSLGDRLAPDRFTAGKKVSLGDTAAGNRAAKMLTCRLLQQNIS
ncbi:MAG: hypothetical protein A2W80_17285 [Candidatus Riflebacteria bacterium GWC2_50_8]|nr:MAG: hypothetical protein A2W80_17285 [Candidatus Riflebacteria bacterium GWC2_50_8]